MTWPLHEEGAAVLPLPGLEPDNLLAILALLGLLRALDEEKPAWRAKAFWRGPPWGAHLHLADPAEPGTVAEAAGRGVAAIAKQYHFEGRKNVDFDRPSYRRFALLKRHDPVVAAIAAELPERDTGQLRPGALVLMFGQGHQDFLTRLVQVPVETRPRDIERALFRRWERVDETDAFRWDPTEDQRYALRFGNPSKAGAANTVHGANRLAAIGFLSFKCLPHHSEQQTQGFVRKNQPGFIWPIWTEPMSLYGIERLMGNLDAPGIVERYRAHRVSNGKFMNVARAMPWRGSGAEPKR